MNELEIDFKNEFKEDIRKLQNQFESEIDATKKSIKNLIDLKAISSTEIDTKLNQIRTELDKYNQTEKLSEMELQTNQSLERIRKEIDSIYTILKTIDNIPDLELKLKQIEQLSNNTITKLSTIEGNYAEVLRLQYKFNNTVLDKINNTVNEYFQSQPIYCRVSKYEDLYKIQNTKNVIALLENGNFFNRRGLYIYNGRKWVHM